MKRILSIFIMLLFFSMNITALGKYDKEGYYKGKHWILYGPIGDLVVDGKTILSSKDYLTISDYKVGDKLYFRTTDRDFESHDDYETLFNIDGERVIPYKFGAVCLGTLQIGNGLFFVVSKYLHGPKDLFTIEGKLLVANYQEEVLSKYIKRITDGKYGEMFLVKAKDENNRIKQGLFTITGESFIPVKYKSLNWTTDDNDNIATFEVTNDNDYIGIMDRDKNWIVPLSKQFTKVTPSEISGKKYFLCMKKGYWGLYDTQFNEVIAPDFEGLEVLDETSFIKFRLNGFWGVMTLQTSTNTTKTIIPTTRGYTSIGRYIKSQKRFTYTMNGYKGECNHLGQQVSKIKVATPVVTPTPVTPKKETTKVEETPKKQEGGGTTTVVVEHHHDPVPVQQWQACFACGGMGTMGCDNCGGSGTKYIGDRLHRCSRCNGRGIIPCNICYGNKGKYITVYQ